MQLSHPERARRGDRHVEYWLSIGVSGENARIAAIDLGLWGLDERRFEASGSPEGIGRVVRVDRGECDVVTADGPVRVASDSVRAQDDLAPVTGDWVLVREVEGVGPAITEILPRVTAVTRRDPAERDVEQVLAANVDVVAVVHGLDRPLPPGRLERLLVVAHQSGARPVVVLTKADLADADADDETEAVVRSVARDLPVVVTSARDGRGLDEVLDLIGPGRTLALVGASGVGKSALVNALVGREVLATGEVRDRDAKGRHTTTARELVALPEGRGLLLDTPGIRAVGLWEAGQALDLVFGDLEVLAERCRFGDCTHTVEPGCAITAAVDAGDVDPRRVARYRGLVEELARQAEREKERERSERRGRRGRRPGR